MIISVFVSNNVLVKITEISMIVDPKILGKDLIESKILKFGIIKKLFFLSLKKIIDEIIICEIIKINV